MIRGVLRRTSDCQGKSERAVWEKEIEWRAAVRSAANLPHRRAYCKAAGLPRPIEVEIDPASGPMAL